MFSLCLYYKKKRQEKQEREKKSTGKEKFIIMGVDGGGENEYYVKCGNVTPNDHRSTEVFDMSLIKCKKCGEMFSDSYKTCPFCAEDEAYYHGHLKKSRGRRAAESHRRSAPSILGPAVIVVLVLLLALVAWLIFGEQIRDALNTDTPPVSNVDRDNTQDDTSTPDNTPVAPTISLNRTVLALTVGDKETLLVTGSDEGASWESSDPTLVTVTASGEVTALAKGTAVITARVGEQSVTCTVTVKEETTEPDESSKKDEDDRKDESASVEVSDLRLTTSFGTTIKPVDGAFDVSLPEGISCDFEVEGTSLTPTWSVGNSSIATVTSDGSVKAISRGETTLTIKLGSTEVKCLLRVTK